MVTHDFSNTLEPQTLHVTGFISCNFTPYSDKIQANSAHQGFCVEQWHEVLTNQCSSVTMTHYGPCKQHMELNAILQNLHSVRALVKQRYCPGRGRADTNNVEHYATCPPSHWRHGLSTLLTFLRHPQWPNLITFKHISPCENTGRSR